MGGMFVFPHKAAKRVSDLGREHRCGLVSYDIAEDKGHTPIITLRC